MANSLSLSLVDYKKKNNNLREIAFLLVKRYTIRRFSSRIRYFFDKQAVRISRKRIVPRL